MLRFEKITDENVRLLGGYFERDISSVICDYTYGTFLIWRDYYGYEYAAEDGVLYTKADDFEGKTAFSFPVAAGDAGAALDKISDYAAYNEMPLYFALLDDRQLSVVKRHFGENAPVRAEFNRKWNDYLYSAKDLSEFSGKKFHGQKNHLNKFKSLYGCEYKDVNDIDKGGLIDFLGRFYEENPPEDRMARFERDRIYDFAENGFGGMNGGVIEAEGKIVAFTLGEVHGSTLFVHIEKALTSYQGSYQAIVSQFAKRFSGGQVKYINREDDLGDAGLRFSKLSYHPIGILEKAAVCVNSCNYIPLSLNAGRVRIRELRKGDCEPYARLAGDIERNRYWGYDYRDDTGGETRTGEYFIGAALCDINSNTEYSYAIENEDGVFIGETVLYNFIGKSAELGIRILKEYEGMGYAREAFGGLSSFLLDKGFFRMMRAKCFERNERSARTIAASGFKERFQRDGFRYFVKQ